MNPINQSIPIMRLFEMVGALFESTIPPRDRDKSNNSGEWNDADVERKKVIEWLGMVYAIKKMKLV